jgi:hypothetical protein
MGVPHVILPILGRDAYDTLIGRGSARAAALDVEGELIARVCAGRQGARSRATLPAVSRAIRVQTLARSSGNSTGSGVLRPDAEHRIARERCGPTDHNATIGCGGPPLLI